MLDEGMVLNLLPSLRQPLLIYLKLPV